jgi:selenocysteine lyase/cysteine desulfurase
MILSLLHPAGDEPPQRICFWCCVHYHKWLCSPPGSPFLYARREVQHLLESLVGSWGWNRGHEVVGLLDLGDRTSRFVNEQEWQGTRDPAAYLSVPAAIQFQAEHDWPHVRAECHEPQRNARRRIEALTRLEPICPDLPEWYVQMAAFRLPACDGAGVQRRLYDEYRVEVPIVEWNSQQRRRSHACTSASSALVRCNQAQRIQSPQWLRITSGRYTGYKARM